MAEVACSSDMTFKETTLSKERSADTRAERQQHDVSKANGRTNPGLSQQCCMSIVENWNRSRSLQRVCPTKSFKSTELPWHAGNRKVVACGQTRCSQTNPARRF